MKGSSSKKPGAKAHPKAPGREASGTRARPKRSGKSEKGASARGAAGKPTARKPTTTQIGAAPQPEPTLQGDVAVQPVAAVQRPVAPPPPDRGPPPPLPIPIASFNI
jgi:hypothetical protein